MTDVTAVPARDIGAGDFADLVSAPVTEIKFTDAGLRVTFEGDLTAAQVAAVQRRICSATAAEETLREQAQTFIDADPTTVTLVQLVRVVQRLARLVLSMRAGRGTN